MQRAAAFGARLGHARAAASPRRSARRPPRGRDAGRARPCDAAAPDAIDRRGRRRRSRRRGSRRRCGRRGRKVGAQADDVGRGAGPQRAAVALERLRPAGRGALVEGAAGRAGGERADVARAARSRCAYSSCLSSAATPISTLESRADAEGAACREIGGALKIAVAEIGLGDRAEAGDRAARAPGARVSSSSMWVAWMGHQRAIDGGVVEQPATGRAPDQARQSSTSLTCSATWMWIGPSPASATTAASSAGVDGAQRMRRDADRTDPAISARQSSSSRAKPSRSVMKRRCSGRGGAPPKVAWA